MLSLGKWLMLMGFGVPLCVGVWTYSRAYEKATNGTPVAEAFSQSETTRNMWITMALIPVGAVGIPIWIIGLMRKSSNKIP